MKRYNRFFLQILIFHLQYFHSWSWFFSLKESHCNKQIVAKVSNNKKGLKLWENGKEMAVSSNPCWQNAYQNLVAGCSDILATEEKRSRLAWHLSDCFQKDSGRPPFPQCDIKSIMMTCLKDLDEDARYIYLEFYLETTSICHQVQADTFKRQMVRLVDELKNSAGNADFNIGNVQGRADDLLESSSNIQDSLASIGIHMQQLSQSSKNVEEHTNIVLKHSESLYQQSTEITHSQLELVEGQTIMRRKVVDGMIMLQDSCDDLGVEIDKLKYEAVEIENEIGKLGDEMSLKMKTLHSKVDDIGNKTGVSLDMQNDLLNGQSLAVEGVQLLTHFMSHALDESRGTLKELAEFGHKQQKELFRRQQQLEKTHGHLIKNSKTILAAQEDFDWKQSTMFLAIDKLFALHNAIILESRWIKTFIVYSILVFTIYMFTSTKQTYTVRPRLYIGLCGSLLFEFVVPKYVTNNIEQQAWIISLVRVLFVLSATAQLLYVIYKHRDYEALNHQILSTLIHKVSRMQENKRKLRDTDSDSEINWSSWIENDLPEDVNKLEDPDYIFPGEVTSTITEIYNIRNYDGF